MTLNASIADVTARIEARSEPLRRRYMDQMRRAAEEGPRRGHLACGNQAHAYAAMGADKDAAMAPSVPRLKA